MERWGTEAWRDRSVLCKTELGLAPLVGDDDHKCIYDLQSSWIPWEWRLWCLKQHHAWMLSFLPSALPPSQLPSSSHAITPGGVSFANTKTWTKTAVTYRLDPLPHASEVRPWTKTVADVGVLPPFFTDRWHIPISLIASLLSCSRFQGAVGSWRPSGWRFHDGECASPAPKKPGVGNGASDHAAVMKPMSLASGNLPWWAVMLKLGPRGLWRSEVKSLSRVWLVVTLWTVAYQAPLSMGFSKQEYWGGLPFSSPGDLPDPGIEPRSPAL